MQDQLEPGRYQAGASNVTGAFLTLVAVAAATSPAAAGEPSRVDLAAWVEAQGGEMERDASGAVVEISLARSWATDSDVERIAGIKTLKRLNLSFTYVTDP